MNDAYYSFPPGPININNTGGGTGHAPPLVPPTGLSSLIGGTNQHHHHLPFGGPSTTGNHSLTGMGGSNGTTGSSSTSASGGDVSDESTATDQPDSKVDIDDEVCPVCQDKVSGYHYGLLTCESCKGFFKRTVQNKKVYTCVGERTCHIDKSQRKRCPFCRFQKCIDVGMKLEAVRADRMRGGRNKFGPMYKRDRARKQQALRTRHVSPQQHGHYPTRHYSNNHKNSHGGGCKMENGSGNGYIFPPSSAYEPTFMKTEMIQIPHLSSTNSPESLQMSGGESSSSTVKSWPNSYSPPTLYHQNGMMHLDMMNGRSPISLNHGLESSEKALQAFPGTVAELQATLMDDRLWQDNLYTLLHSQTYNQCEVDLFELLSKVLDQCLFSQVDWARNSAFFKDLKLEDQMTLLQHSWSDLLILDFIYHRLRNSLPNETTLPNGQIFNLLDLALLGHNNNMDSLQSLTARFRDLKMDRSDYVCLKFILLLAHGTPGLNDRLHVQTGQDKVQSILLDHCLAMHPTMPDRFSQLLLQIPELRLMANQGEDFLYYKHMTCAISDTTLLMELLLAKRKC